MSALRIVVRGDMSASQMRGGWAGQIGQTQFLPSSYSNCAVDFDGSGHRDLINSVPGILASTAELPEGSWLGRRPALRPGTRILPRARGMEQGRGLPAHHRRHGREAGALRAHDRVRPYQISDAWIIGSKRGPR